MRTLELCHPDAILYDNPPDQVCQTKYPGHRLVELYGARRSLIRGTMYCRTWSVVPVGTSDPFAGVAYLVEIPT